MTWTAYRVILRLHTPLHIGWGRVSYLQRARPYVTGRVLRGALVSRVARNQNLIGEEMGDPYRRVSKTFAQYLTFTYFYPALKEGADWKAQFPWDDETAFRRRFLSSYAATALAYPSQTAAEGLLYETEFIAPHTLDDGKPVYLLGYVFVDEEQLRLEKYDWKSAFCRLQLGGERGYGWGEARLERIDRIPNGTPLFGRDIRLDLQQKRPAVHLKAGEPVLAHTDTKAGSISGTLEPMVGREWRADNQEKHQRQEIHIGQHLRYDGILFAPGSRVTSPDSFFIKEGSYWFPMSKEKLV